MSDDRNANYEDRIDTQLLKMERWYRGRYKRLDKARWEGDDSRAAELAEDLTPREVSVRQLFRIRPSWGGLFVRIEVEVDDGQVAAVRFYFLEWFQLSRPLSEASHPALLRLAKETATAAAAEMAL